MDLSPVVTLLCLCLNVAPSEPTVTCGSRVRFTFKASEAMWLEAGQDRIAAPLASPAPGDSNSDTTQAS